MSLLSIYILRKTINVLILFTVSSADVTFESVLYFAPSASSLIP